MWTPLRRRWERGRARSLHAAERDRGTQPGCSPATDCADDPPARQRQQHGKHDHLRGYVRGKVEGAHGAAGRDRLPETAAAPGMGR